MKYSSNAYLASKGADTVDLDKFRALPSSKAPEPSRLAGSPISCNSLWTLRGGPAIAAAQRNPDFGDTFPQAVPTSLWAIIPPSPKPTPTCPPATTFKRLQTRRLPLRHHPSKAAPASIPPWRRGSQTLKFCESCSASGPRKPCTSRPGRTRPEMLPL